MARGYTEEEKDMLDFFLTNVKQGKLNSLRALEEMLKDYYEKNNLQLIGIYNGKIRDGETMCDLFQSQVYH